MKKIAFVYDAVYPYIKGGGEKRFYDIGTRLVKKGYEVHLYGMKLWDGEKVIKKDGMYYHGISKAMNLYSKNGKRSLLQPIYFGLSCLKLVKEDFDIIDCCGFPYYSLFSCKFVCWLKGKPLYSTWHEVWGKEYWKSYIGKKGIIGYMIEKMASKMPDKIIAVSEHTKNGLKKKLKLKNKETVVIPNGIDFNYINKIKKSKENSDIIYAGRLLDYKNINILIKAIKIAKLKFPNIKCLIVGDGPERDNLERLVKKLGLEKDIIFKGFLEIEEVYSLMKASKVFVLPSSREGFGLVVIEANACGIPVITVNEKDNAAKDLIKNNENGVVCNLDEKEIAEKIIKTIVAKNMQEDCISSAKKYDWEDLVKNLQEVYGK